MKKTMFNRLIACTLGCTMLPTFEFTISAEEQPKNFSYYASLSDYEVYVEYCETYGFTVEETLPEKEQLPDYYNYSSYMLPYGEYYFEIECMDTILDVDAATLNQDFAFFGFSEEWRDGLLFSVSSSDPNEEEYGDYINCIFNCDPQFALVDPGIWFLYRMRLTLENSDFIKQYGYSKEWSNIRYPLMDGPVTPLFGDANGDRKINSLDSAKILEWASNVGINKSELTDEQVKEIFGIELSVSDVNSDDSIDALDAAMILRYSALAGTDSSNHFPTFVLNETR